MSLQKDVPDSLTPSEKSLEDVHSPDSLAEATTEGLSDDALGGTASEKDADVNVETKIND